MLMKKAKSLFYILLILAMVAAGGYMYMNFSGLDSQQTITSTTLRETLVDIAELGTVEYNYTDIGKFEEAYELNGVKVPFTGKSFIITYDGRVKAGIRLEELVISVKETSVEIKVGNGIILSHEIFEDTIEVYDEQNNIFNPIEIADYATFATEQKIKKEQDAKDKGVLEEAREKARTLIEGYVRNVLPPEYTLEVK